MFGKNECRDCFWKEANLESENFVFEAQKYNGKMIIVALQLDDWGETLANNTIELVLIK